MPALATVTSYLNNNNNQDELANVDKGVWGKDPLLCIYPPELHSPSDWKDTFIPVFIISLFTVVRYVEIN